MNRISTKRETVLEFLYGKPFVYKCDIQDTRSLNWLENNGFVIIGFSPKELTSVVKITDKGLDYLKSQPAWR